MYFLDQTCFKAYMQHMSSTRIKDGLDVMHVLLSQMSACLKPKGYICGLLCFTFFPLLVCLPGIEAHCDAGCYHKLYAALY